MRVLITNYRLVNRTGTELYACDLALTLMRRGHHPVIYSPHLGNLAIAARNEGVPIMDDLERLSVTPDIIHGQQLNETMTALLRFPSTPAVYFCHDWYAERDEPPQFPRVLRYVAVDGTCYDRLVCENGIPEDRVRLLYQFVDLEKFLPRRRPLPAKPRRALALCNATYEDEYLAALRAACARRDVALDVYGAGVERECAEPEKILHEYDIVFAKARTALEAAATGAAVIVYWRCRLGPVARSENLESLRRDNFGVRAMGPQLSAEEFGREVERLIASYDANDAAEVARRVRAVAGRENAADEILAIYEDTLNEYREGGGRDAEGEARAAASFIRKLTLASDALRESVYGSTIFRLTERVENVPFVGGFARKAARKLAGRK